MSDAEATLPLDDETARERIRASLDESLLVEAAAGTGKTTELVRRVVEVLAQGRASVDEIVAVTFTRKAAGELKLRLRERLDREREASVDGERRSNLEDAISRLEAARIGTIHSFCADMLRERPVEAGVDPGFVEVADDESPKLYAQAFDFWIQEQLEELPTGLRRALSRLALFPGFMQGSPIDRLRDAGWRLAEWRDYPAPWRRETFDREGWIDRLVGSLARLAELARRCSNRRDPLRRSLEPVSLLDTWIERAEAIAQRDYDALEARLLDLLRQLRRPFNRRKGRGKFAEALPREQVLEEREALLSELERFRDAADADLAALLHAELGSATERYENLKRRLGKLDFSDLLIRTRDLLRSSATVRRYLQGRCSHIFVDEFQDTDPLQAEIVLLLSADDATESDWREVRPVPGKLFLVGDPKQSIYRFRRADVLLYQEIQEHLERVGVGLVRLTTSFRSVAPIQALVNSAFAPEMDGDAQSGRPSYIALGGHRLASADQPSVIALPVPEPYGWRGIAKTRIEQSLPDAVGAFVHWLLAESGFEVEDPETKESVALRAQHVCILFRRFLSWGRDVTRDYTRALEVRGVSHLLLGARTFHHREEVETLRAALTAIEWPDDELAVYATLRGSLFAVPDDVLLRFRERAAGFHPFRWRRRASKGSAEELPQELTVVGEILDLLADWHRRRNERAIVETVQELLATTRAHAGFALRPAGNQVLGNVERVCELARSYELGGGRSFRGFVDQLNTEADKPASGQAPVVEEGSEGVRLMTVHTAKGLEYPVVILADMTARLSSMYPDRTVDAAQGLAASRVLGCNPHELLERTELERERDRAEGTRIAYVAATRARDLLVVPAVGDRPLDGWLEPLNKAIYPDSGGWRRAEPAPGCPELGSRSVLERPAEHDGRIESSVRPGLHRFGEDAYGVVWWDPQLLDLKIEGSFGLRQEEILSEDEGAVVALENREHYENWKARQSEIRKRGRRQSYEVLAVTSLEEDPPPSTVGERPAVEVIELERDRGRPRGRCFGDLVHDTLRQVAPGWLPEEVHRLTTLVGRELGATSVEVESAARAVNGALQAEVLAGLADAQHRESPFLVGLDDGRILEGTLDFAFEDGDRWVVVDFKTDLDLEASSDRYRRQVAWYQFALEKLTGKPARGVVLGV